MGGAAALPHRNGGFDAERRSGGSGLAGFQVGILPTADSATTRGRTGFDGDVESGIAGGGAWPP